MSDVLVTRTHDIATVALSHPGKLNAIDTAMWRRLRAVFEDLTRDTSLRCVIVQGCEGNFAAGADIEEFSSVRATMEQGIAYHEELIAPALQAITECLHPTVAAIEGVCIGGGLEIACACDIRIAQHGSRFGIPINRLGFPLAPRELQGLLQLVGKAHTLEILLEGRVFDAEEALAKGLLHRLAADVHSAAAEAAGRIAQGAPLAARANKAMARRLSQSVEPLSEQELKAAYAFLDSDDYREGVQSFLAKRPPEFQGR
ncbi:MAG TPA: enoyl-CoA hydratase-related protein [Burkholderiaceae bacterium]